MHNRNELQHTHAGKEGNGDIFYYPRRMNAMQFDKHRVTRLCGKRRGKDEVEGSHYIREFAR